METNKRRRQQSSRMEMQMQTIQAKIGEGDEEMKEIIIEKNSIAPCPYCYRFIKITIKPKAAKGKVK